MPIRQCNRRGISDRQGQQNCLWSSFVCLLLYGRTTYSRRPISYAVFCLKKKKWTSNSTMSLQFASHWPGANGHQFASVGNNNHTYCSSNSIYESPLALIVHALEIDARLALLLFLNFSITMYKLIPTPSLSVSTTAGMEFVAPD